MSSEVAKKKKSKAPPAQQRSDTRQRPPSPVLQDDTASCDEVDYTALVAPLGPYDAVKAVFMHLRKEGINKKKGVTKPSAELVHKMLEDTKHESLSLAEITQHRNDLMAAQESQKQVAKTEKLNLYAAAAKEYGYDGGNHKPLVTESETVRFVKWIAGVGADPDFVCPADGVVTRTAKEVERQLKVREIILTQPVVQCLQGLADDNMREVWETAYRLTISKGCKSISPRTIYNIIKNDAMLAKMYHPPTDVPIGALHTAVMNFKEIAEIANDETVPEEKRDRAEKQMDKHPFKNCEVQDDWLKEAAAVKDLLVAHKEKRAAAKVAKEQAKAAKEAAKEAANASGHAGEDEFADPVPPLVPVPTTEAGSSSEATSGKKGGKKKRAAPADAPADEAEAPVASEKKKKKKTAPASSA